MPNILIKWNICVIFYNNITLNDLTSDTTLTKTNLTYGSSIWL